MTTDEIAVLITGPSNGGLGAETAVSLARGTPSMIILAGRSEAKIEAVRQQINIISPTTRTVFIELDLSSQASVRKAAKDISIQVDHLDAMINNAGIMACPYSTTEDGIERQFGTNHIGHFLLTNLLMGKFRRGSRIVTVTSWAHNMCEVRFDDINFQVRCVFTPKGSF